MYMQSYDFHSPSSIISRLVACALHHASVELSYLFQRLPSGLDQAKPTVQCNEDTKQAPNEKRSPAQILDHVGCRDAEDHI